MKIIIEVTHSCGHSYSHTLLVTDAMRFSAFTTKRRLKDVPCPNCIDVSVPPIFFNGADYQGGREIAHA